METNIGQFLAKRAYLNPNMEAVVDTATGLRFTFAEVDARANRLANAMLARGVRAGDRVGVLMMNGEEFLESFFGLAKIGAVVVPLNWRLVADELAYILSDSGTSVLLYSTEFAEIVADIHSRGAEGSRVAAWIEHGPAEARQVFSDAYEAVLEAASAEAPAQGARDDDLLFIMYTSGTTGLPKGVMHTHESVFWALTTIAVTADSRFGDRYIIALPMFHVGALTPVLGNVMIGTTSILMRQFDPSAMWRLIEAEKVTTTLAVPAMLNFMLQVPAAKEHDYSTLRWIMSGASPVPAALIETYKDLGIEIHQVYGLTECGGPGCLISPDDAMSHIGSTGKAFFHNEVRVVDEKGEDVAPGVPGEVIIRGRQNMKGYWNKPEATAEAIRDGWLHTGDIALIDDEGFITIHDRLKDMVISGGENVYPAEIENVVMQHPQVAEVAVIGMPSERWGESPFCVVVRKDETLSEADILRFCDGKLAAYKQPKGAAFIEEIPRNPTGKPLKRLLRDQFPGPAPN